MLILKLDNTININVNINKFVLIHKNLFLRIRLMKRVNLK
jgi:hypothetical protein